MGKTIVPKLPPIYGHKRIIVDGHFKIERGMIYVKDVSNSFSRLILRVEKFFSKMLGISVAADFSLRLGMLNISDIMAINGHCFSAKQLNNIVLDITDVVITAIPSIRIINDIGFVSLDALYVDVKS